MGDVDNTQGMTRGNQEGGGKHGGGGGVRCELVDY